MFQGFRELLAAKGRTLLIVVTVGMITLMVTFLSSLAGGLSYQSVSALKYRLDSVAGADSALVLTEAGAAPSWSSSQLTDEQLAAVERQGGHPLRIARDRVDADPVIYLSDPTVAPGTAVANAPLVASHPTVNPGGHPLSTRQADKDIFLDHMPVIRISEQDATTLARTNVAAVLDHPGAPIPGTTQLTGSQRWEASSSYQGEQMSLNLMITLLYVISGLVLGAFFMVWTMQRLRGVSISSALGASRRVLAADSLGQAVAVLALGILGGVAVTVAAASVMGGALPIELSTQSTVKPTLILLACGLAGAALSLRPVLTTSPRAALANA
ncbi:FtsX-like permease family protein [Corynebacterium heidelbergense]|uniref:ABC transporter permease n=1 Tax=Corynebacterium heidelbergense TaxID=2055947 RepID=A0A364V421_9CORY|nr:ABC transporter permease [Corynebacterium heidelbergense]RAV31384.1 ABC transporter permease [Corynebacterium heidelbergense]